MTVSAVLLVVKSVELSTPHVEPFGNMSKSMGTAMA